MSSKLKFADRNIATLDEVESANFHSFSVHCPHCATSICQLSTEAVSGFEAVCPGCGSALFLASTVAVADWYAYWTEDDEDTDVGKRRFETVNEEHLRDAIRESWAEMDDEVTRSLKHADTATTWEWADE